MSEKLWRWLVLVLLFANVVGAMGSAYLYRGTQTNTDRRLDLLEKWQLDQMTYHEKQMSRNDADTQAKIKMQKEIDLLNKGKSK